MRLKTCKNNQRYGINIRDAAVLGTLSSSLQFRPHSFVILEALSATGLRSIRYANEIPHVK